MGKFIESIRTGGTKAPQQRGFKLLNWEGAFNRLTPHDAEDTEVYEAGLWFAHEFKQVREITEKGVSDFHWSTPRDRTLAFVGCAIRDWMVIGHQVTEHLMKSETPGCFVSELDYVPVQSPFFNKADPAGLIEVLVDGLRYPLSLEFQEDSSANPRGTGSLDDLSSFMRLVWTGQHYHTLQQVWLDCVWNGFRVDNSGAKTVIRHRDTSCGQRQVVSEFRRWSLAVEATQRAVMLWQHQMNGETRRRILSQRNVFSVYKKHGKFRVKAINALRFEDRVSSMPILQKMLTPEHAGPLLGKKLASFRNLTLSQLLDAYDLLSLIPEQVATCLPKDSGIKRPEDLLSWPPIFSKKELIKAFGDALNAQESQASWLVEFMTHTRSVREQLWFKPIVQVGGDELTVLLPAVQGVHFARLLDWLLARDTAVEQELGPLFEKLVHSKLKREFSESPIRGLLKISIASGIKVRIGDVEDEIDLAFAVGHKVFICELKSTQFPTEPLEHLNYRKRLDEAADQASRKAEFVAANPHSALAQLGLNYVKDSLSVEIHPLIVSSSPLFAGWTWNNVAVCDSFILGRFFVEGKLELLGFQDDIGIFIPTQTETFYKSPAEAEASIVGYFEHAPQVRLFEKFIKTLEYPLPVFSETEKTKLVQTFAVQPPHDTLRKIIQAARRPG